MTGTAKIWMAAVGALALGGCATADLRPGIVRHETPKQIWSKFHGPSVRIRAQVVATHNSRMIEPVVYLADSAYLVIGDIGDDGTLRILYPAQPGDVHLVQKTRSFEGPRFQPRLELPFIQSAFTPGALGARNRVRDRVFLSARPQQARRGQPVVDLRRVLRESHE